MFLSARNALVCSHDHLTLFLTLVSGLEFIRFDLELVSMRFMTTSIYKAALKSIVACVCV